MSNRDIPLSYLEQLSYDDINHHKVSLVPILMTLIKEVAELKKAAKDEPDTETNSTDTP